LRTGSEQFYKPWRNQKTILVHLVYFVKSLSGLSEDTTIEKSRGQIETRTVTVYNTPEGINSDWKGLERISHYRDLI